MFLFVCFLSSWSFVEVIYRGSPCIDKNMYTNHNAPLYDRLELLLHTGQRQDNIHDGFAVEMTCVGKDINDGL